MGKVSIVVPVFNVSGYIRECIYSIINQTYKNIEIIIVDDGSTDSSPAIVDELAQTDDRIIVIHQKNTGLPGARNTGLKHATGIYIGFIDSDDRIKKNMFELLVKNIENYDADLCICNLLRFNKKISIFSDRYKDCMISYDEKQSINFYDLILDSSCNKLYNLETIRRFNIQFEDKSIVPQEDFYFLLKYIANINKVVTLAEPLYEYRIRKSSISNTKQPDNFIDGCIRFIDLASKYHLDNHIKRNLSDFSMALLVSMMQSCINNVNEINPKQVLKIINSFKEHKLFEPAILYKLKVIQQSKISVREIYMFLIFILFKLKFFYILAQIEVIRIYQLRKRSNNFAYP